MLPPKSKTGRFWSILKHTFAHYGDYVDANGALWLKFLRFSLFFVCQDAAPPSCCSFACASQTCSRGRAYRDERCLHILTCNFGHARSKKSRRKSRGCHKSLLTCCLPRPVDWPPLLIHCDPLIALQCRLLWGSEAGGSRWKQKIKTEPCSNRCFLKHPDNTATR